MPRTFLILLMDYSGKKQVVFCCCLPFNTTAIIIRGMDLSVSVSKHNLESNTVFIVFIIDQCLDNSKSNRWGMNLFKFKLHINIFEF